jgi:hypothetical protein
MASDLERSVLAAIGRWAGGVAGTVKGAVEVAGDSGLGSPEPTAPEPRNRETHFEHSDISARGVFITGILVLAGISVITGVLYFFFAYLVHERAESSPPPLPSEEHQNPMPPEPRLQESPRQDLKAMRTREDIELNSYSWVDKTKGTVTIPIERAIQILVQRGIPPQKASPNLPLSQPQAGTRETGFQEKVEPEPR